MELIKSLPGAANKKPLNKMKLSRDIEYYSNGTIWKTTDQVDNINHGQSTVFYPTGRIQALMHYVDGELHGKYLLMYENGSIWVESNYLDGAEHGECRVYHENGNLKSISHYNSGVLTGEYLEYYQNGSLKEKAMYKDNVKVDRQSTFYKDGSLKTIIFYKGMDRQSLYIEYHPNGELNKLNRYDDNTGKLLNKYIFNEKGDCVLWTLLNPKKKGASVLHLNSVELKKLL